MQWNKKQTECEQKRKNSISKFIAHKRSAIVWGNELADAEPKHINQLGGKSGSQAKQPNTQQNRM